MIGLTTGFATGLMIGLTTGFATGFAGDLRTGLTTGLGEVPGFAWDPIVGSGEVSGSAWGLSVAIAVNWCKGSHLASWEAVHLGMP